jgi:hypothetical protein
MRIDRFTFLTSVQLLICSAALCAASSVAPGAPLVVDDHSHVVVMEYEAWSGPKAVTFQGTAAKPLLQSADMQAVGGGYDSADPAIIRQHVAWLEYMGVDAAISEVTNNVSCIFNSEAFAKKYLPYCTPSFRVYNQNLRDNTGKLYPAWTKLGTRLKLIPLLVVRRDVLQTHPLTTGPNHIPDYILPRYPSPKPSPSWRRHGISHPSLTPAVRSTTAQ